MSNFLPIASLNLIRSRSDIGAIWKLVLAFSTRLKNFAGSLLSYSLPAACLYISRVACGTWSIGNVSV